MKKIICSRKMRAAASAFMMIPISIISFMFHHYGFDLYALVFEGIPIVMYAIWIRLGPIRDDSTYNPADDPED
jgi:hypothetical protein